MVVKAGSDNTIIATIILPVDDDSEARGIVSSVKRTVVDSSNLSISFIKPEKNTAIPLLKEKTGLYWKDKMINGTVQQHEEMKHTQEMLQL